MSNQPVNTQIRSLNKEFSQFVGTDSYHKFSALFPKYLLTDGVHHIVNKLGLNWFIDTILSYQIYKKVKADYLQNWKLIRITAGEDAGKWYVVLYDRNNIPILNQVFDTVCLTDGYEENFDSFTVYLVDNIVLLPSEN